MSDKSYKTQSREDWIPNPADRQVNTDEIKVGCLQRIADATELMAKNHAQIVEERDRYVRWYKQERERTESFRKHIAGLRGYITRLKRGKQ